MWNCQVLFEGENKEGYIHGFTSNNFFGLAVTRKIGSSAMTQLSLEASTFFSAQWAHDKGLYMKICSSKESLDAEVKQFAEQLCSYNPEALMQLKKTIWDGTAHWAELLKKRAAISGRLVLSEFTKSQLKNRSK